MLALIVLGYGTWDVAALYIEAVDSIRRFEVTQYSNRFTL
jgi:hypothetical protein